MKMCIYTDHPDGWDGLHTEYIRMDSYYDSHFCKYMAGMPGEWEMSVILRAIHSS